MSLAHVFHPFQPFLHTQFILLSSTKLKIVANIVIANVPTPVPQSILSLETLLRFSKSSYHVGHSIIEWDERVMTELRTRCANLILQIIIVVVGSHLLPQSVGHQIIKFVCILINAHNAPKTIALSTRIPTLKALLGLFSKGASFRQRLVLALFPSGLGGAHLNGK